MPRHSSRRLIDPPTHDAGYPAGGVDLRHAMATGQPPHLDVTGREYLAAPGRSRDIRCQFDSGRFGSPIEQFDERGHAPPGNQLDQGGVACSLGIRCPPAGIGRHGRSRERGWITRIADQWKLQAVGRHCRRGLERHGRCHRAMPQRYGVAAAETIQSPVRDRRGEPGPHAGGAGNPAGRPVPPLYGGPQDRPTREKALRPWTFAEANVSRRQVAGRAAPRAGGLRRHAGAAGPAGTR